MDIVNQTPLAAKLTISALAGTDHRFGVLTAKATFQYDDDGVVTLDTQDPLPLFAKDEPTKLGLLPRDDLYRQDAAFEVILLGAASSALPVSQMTVSLSVGSVLREIAVFGDRRWLSRAEISDPIPFTTMPLVYERAYGGHADVLVDVDSPLGVADPTNPYGRGFDLEGQVRGLVHLLKPPRGFPVYSKERLLPNLEDPSRRIQHWDDAPRPTCWATVPMETALHLARAVDLEAVERRARAGEYGSDTLFSPGTIKDGFFHRAHPDWVIPMPEPASVVEGRGLGPRGRFSFRLPGLRVSADFVAGTRRGELDLAPQMMVVLAEERRFYVVYRDVFTLAPVEPHDERSFRLRVDGAPPPS